MIVYGYRPTKPKPQFHLPFLKIFIMQLYENVDYHCVLTTINDMSTLSVYNTQIMNGFSCDGTDIFMRCKVKCSIQRGEAKLNRTYHLPLNQNMCAIARMKNFNYMFLYNIKNIFCHLQQLIDLYILENTNSVLITPWQVKGHCSALLNAALYYYTILLNTDVTCVKWCIYFISYDLVSSNQMTRVHRC